MPVISSFYGILIKMYFGDHNAPHFHAGYAEFKAQISIVDFAILNGHLPPKAISLVIEWASFHRDELLENWKNMSMDGNGVCKRIEPLK